MRGIRVRVSSHLLCQWCGLEDSDIRVAAVSTEYPHTLIFTLVGSDPQLPFVEPGAKYPEGHVICTADPTLTGYRGSIEIDRPSKPGAPLAP